METADRPQDTGLAATRSPRPDFPQRGKTHGAQHPDAVHLIGGPGLNLAACGQARTPEKMDPDRPDVITWSPLLTAREELVTCLACLIKLDDTAPTDTMEAETNRIDPDLEQALHELFDRYGVLGVITAAARYGLRVATPKERS